MMRSDSGGIVATMTSDQRARAHERAAATARLRRITLGTTAAGIAATIGFGSVAAMTFTGTPGSDTTSDPSTVTTPDTTTDSRSNGATDPSDGGTFTQPTTRPRSNGSGSGGSDFFAAPNDGFSGGGGRPHVSTGGS